METLVNRKIEYKKQIVVTIFDTETATGFSKTPSWLGADSKNHPKICQLAYKTFTFNLGENAIDYILSNVEMYNNYIYPEDAQGEYKVGNTEIHGISHELCLREGVSIITAIKDLKSAFEQSDIIVGHKVSFDSANVCAAAELNNLNKDMSFFKTIKVGDNDKRYCTMINTKHIVKAPNKAGNIKFPKLIELYNHLFGEDFVDAHNALGDVNATALIFEKLLNEYRTEANLEKYLLK